jgi:hypothetical protein
MLACESSEHCLLSTDVCAASQYIDYSPAPNNYREIEVVVVIPANHVWWERENHYDILVCDLVGGQLDICTLLVVVEVN